MFEKNMLLYSNGRNPGTGDWPFEKGGGGSRSYRCNTECEISETQAGEYIKETLIEQFTGFPFGINRKINIPSLIVFIINSIVIVLIDIFLI